MFAEKNNLDYKDVKDIITDTAKDRNIAGITETTQTERDLVEILRALNINIGRFLPTKENAVLGSTFPGGQTIQDRIAIDANVDLKTIIQNVQINLPDNALASVAEEAGKRVTEALLNNEEMAKKLANVIRPYA